MTLDALAVALQGIGYTPEAVALQGFAKVDLFVAVGGGGAAAGVASRLKQSLPFDELDLVDQIHRQDDEVLTIIMLTVLRGDVL